MALFNAWHTDQPSCVYLTGGGSKSRLALNKLIIDIKRTLNQRFKSDFPVFRKVTTSPKRSPYSVSDGAIITFNANGKNLPMAWIKPLKPVTKLSHVSLAILAQVTKFLQFSFKLLTVLRSRFPQT